MESAMSAKPPAAEPDFEKVFPEARQYTVHQRGKPEEVVSVLPFLFGEVPRVLKACKALLELFEGDILVRQKNSVTINKAELAKLLVDRSEECVQLTSVLLSKPLEWVQALEQNEALDLLGVALEVNADFFVRCVLPSILGVMGRFANLTSPGGQTNSNSSSEEATDTPT
jgi:hypothetical protein